MERGMLVDKEISSILEGFDNITARRVIEKISGLKERMITKEFIAENANKIREIIDDKNIIEKFKVNLNLEVEISREIKVERKEAVLENVKVLFSHSNATKKIEPGDFTRYFRVRYSEIKRILQERKELENLSSINKLGGQKQNVSLIGMVFSKRVSKNKNIILEIEDLTGKIMVLVTKNKPEVYSKAKEVIVDDIVGIKGVGDKEFIYANDIIYPDSMLSEKAHIDNDESVAFISDIHVGSNNFLEKNFQKFISWINGEVGDEKQREEARKVKYLLVTGDCVDGVGVFPGQEFLITIKDIKGQYKKLAEYLSSIRKEVKIILCPGQHDAVRVAEPQPFIGKEYAKELYDIDNLILVSNPALIEIGNNGKKGVRVLMYHGASLNSFVSEIESLRIGKAHDNPSLVVKEMLKRRHLASIHSSVTYIPNEKEDVLLIKDIPDIINTADFHRPSVDLYNNVLIITSSCWQSITPFEEKVGNHPDPCKVPVLNLKTRAIKILDFSADEEKGGVEKENKIVCEVGKS